MTTQPDATRGLPRFSTLDALVLMPLAAPFVLIPLGFVAWGLWQLGAGYVVALHTPAAAESWWQWPWGWPGARITESFYAAVGFPPASDFTFASPLRLFADLDVIDRAIVALFINSMVAVLPLTLALLLTGGTLRLIRWAQNGMGR